MTNTRTTSKKTTIQKFAILFCLFSLTFPPALARFSTPTAICSCEGGKSDEGSGKLKNAPTHWVTMPTPGADVSVTTVGKNDIGCRYIDGKLQMKQHEQVCLCGGWLKTQQLFRLYLPSQEHEGRLCQKITSATYLQPQRKERTEEWRCTGPSTVSPRPVCGTSSLSRRQLEQKQLLTIGPW